MIVITVAWICLHAMVANEIGLRFTFSQNSLVSPLVIWFVYDL